jgi:DinB superfamily
MRKALVFGFMTALVVHAGTGAMNNEERAYLLDQLEQSRKAMLASIDGLTQAQWTFKPAPDVWSVQECAEHIVLAETYIFGGAQQVLKSPAVERPEKSNSNVDHGIVAGVQDRSQKAKAPEPLVPGRKFATPADAAKAFEAAREKTIAYVKSTEDDLRTHVGPGPAGPMDAYQFLLLLSSHSARHTAQIREVEANSGYPKP